MHTLVCVLSVNFACYSYQHSILEKVFVFCSNHVITKSKLICRHILVIHPLYGTQLILLMVVGQQL